MRPEAAQTKDARLRAPRISGKTDIKTHDNPQVSSPNTPWIIDYPAFQELTVTFLPKQGSISPQVPYGTTLTTLPCRLTALLLLWQQARQS